MASGTMVETLDQQLAGLSLSPEISALASRASYHEAMPAGSCGRGVGLVYDARMMMHEDPEGDHPEQPARISSIYGLLEELGLAARCVQVAAREATDEELQGVHTARHVALMRSVSTKLDDSERDQLAMMHNSIYFNRGSSSSALLAAGSVVELAVAVARGELQSGAAVVRPPGHHAEQDKAMGFCLFNNVAVAAHVLLRQQAQLLGVKKILVVDWDVHHGNGIQNMFWEDADLLYFSTHRYEDGFFYPGGKGGDFDQVGEGKGAGFNINVPWPGGGMGDADYLAAWDHVLMPVAREFNPDLVLISAGFDAAMGDPLGGCSLTPFGYSQMTHKLRELAGGRLVLALEGGYNLTSISAAYAACVAAMLGDLPLSDWPESLPREPSLGAVKAIEQVRESLAPYWSVLQAPLEAPLSLQVLTGPITVPEPSKTQRRLTAVSDAEDSLPFPTTADGPISPAASASHRATAGTPSFRSVKRKPPQRTPFSLRPRANGKRESDPSC